MCREKERLKANIEDIVDVAVESLLNSGFYKWLSPTAESVKQAFKLRMLGHRDNIDNLLYTTSALEDMLLLTMDEDLKDFLLRNNFKADNLIDHKKLIEMSEVEK